jgi:hypothetical protein
MVGRFMGWKVEVKIYGQQTDYAKRNGRGEVA